MVPRKKQFIFCFFTVVFTVLTIMSLTNSADSFEVTKESVQQYFLKQKEVEKEVAVSVNSSVIEGKIQPVESLGEVLLQVQFNNVFSDDIEQNNDILSDDVELNSNSVDLVVSPDNSDNLSGLSSPVITELGDLKEESIDEAKIKSGYIVYDLGGYAVKGKKTVYFDDYGKLYYELREETLTGEMSNIDFSCECRTLVLRHDNLIYNIDLDTMTGVVSDIAELIADSPEQDNEAFDENIVDYGGNIVGETEFLERDCKIVELYGTRMLLYKNSIPLKLESYDGTSISEDIPILVSEEAVLFEENIEVPEEIFKLPEDIQFLDMQKSSVFPDKPLSLTD